MHAQCTVTVTCQVMHHSCLPQCLVLWLTMTPLWLRNLELFVHSLTLWLVCVYVCVCVCVYEASSCISVTVCSLTAVSLSHQHQPGTSNKGQDLAPLCCCKVTGSVVGRNKRPVYCQALDSIDEKVSWDFNNYVLGGVAVVGDSCNLDNLWTPMLCNCLFHWLVLCWKFVLSRDQFPQGLDVSAWRARPPT